MESKKNQLNTLNLQYQRAKKARDIHAAQMVEKYGSKLWFMYKHFGKEVPESFDEDLQSRKNYNNEVDIIKKQIEKLNYDIQREKSIQAYRQKQNEDNGLFSAAIEEYGVTNDFNVCGYIIPDGQMLRFGSSGSRDTDHRNIKSVYNEVGIVVNGDDTDYLIDFMQRGAIRFMPECNGFNMCVEPTNDQYACIKDICRSVGGEVMVDFDDNNGQTIHSVQYNSVKPQRLVADIYHYFNEGIKPFGDTNESKIKNGRILKESVDMSMVGQVNYSWDFDEDEYNEYLQENGLENNQQAFEEYLQDYVEFDIEYLDNETFHTMDGEYLNYYDVIESFGEKMAMEMVRNCQKRGEGSFETYELYDEEVDINNPNELNDIAVKLLQHGKYYKDCRGFILTNGEVVYTPAEHNQCTIIDGVKNTFHFIRLGNIRVLQQAIDLSKPPTKEQIDVLRKVIASYSDSELYVDIITQNGEFGAKYVNPDWRFVLAEIDRYFKEGIKPKGRQQSYESLKIIKNILKEEVEIPSIEVSGGADDFDLYCNGIKVAKYFYTDNDAYPVLIFKGETYIGKPGSTHKDIVCEINGYGNYKGFETEMEGMDKYGIYEEYHAMKYAMEDEDPNMLEGRVWLQPKRKEVPYAILYFWGLMGYNTLKSFKRNVDEICDNLGVDTNNLLMCIGDEETGDWKAKAITYNDWSGVVSQMTDKQKQLKAIHNLPPKEKHKELQGWMDSHNKVMNDKLAYRDHEGNIRSDKEPMTMAQYHSLIYQESKKNTKNIIISEEQYNRLFMKKMNVELNPNLLQDICCLIEPKKLLESQHVSIETEKEAQKVLDLLLTMIQDGEIDSDKALSVTDERTNILPVKEYKTIKEIELFGENINCYIKVFFCDSEEDLLKVPNMPTSNINWKYKKMVLVLVCCNHQLSLDKTSDTIWHEIMHGMQNNYINLKGKRKSKNGQDLMAVALQMCRSQNQTISSIGYLIYVTSRFEMPAFMSGAYGQLKAIYQFNGTITQEMLQNIEGYKLMVFCKKKIEEIQHNNSNEEISMVLKQFNISWSANHFMALMVKKINRGFKVLYAIYSRLRDEFENNMAEISIHEIESKPQCLICVR